MNLSRLFFICLHVQYSQTGISASYALKRVGSTLYLFFEGSNGANDWKNNLDFPAKAYKRMGKTVWFAHRGFLRVWKEIEAAIAKDIADETVKKIIVTGYSHGAAIALLCHEYIWYHRPDLRESGESYGFGCPRVFWGIPTKALKQRWKYFSVIRNIDDIITHLPPAFLGFSHVGKMVKIGARGKYSSIQAHYAENILKELRALEQ